MEEFCHIKVVAVNEALHWFPSLDQDFHICKDKKEQQRLGGWLSALENGSCLPVRGRDWSGPHDFTEWDGGVAIKNKERLFFMYESGCLESFRIFDINFSDLIHFAIGSIDDEGSLHIEESNVVIISHGWSQEVGPDYPLIRTLECAAGRCGWKAIVPDFRPSYRYTSQRGRAERVKMIYEEMLCLSPKAKRIVLIGHSQGGAASTLACTKRVVECCNIKGLLLFGSENPSNCSLDGMNWIPPFTKENGLIVHATGDLVISQREMEEVAKKWSIGFIGLTSNVKVGEVDCWGDDINHDFTAKDLMTSAVDIMTNFLKKIETE